jgi:hypothetical protein
MAASATELEKVGRPKRNVPRPIDPEPDGRVVIVHLKGSHEYATWLDDFFRETSIPKASMFRLAMRDYAVKKGFRPPPEM